MTIAAAPSTPFPTIEKKPRREDRAANPSLIRLMIENPDLMQRPIVVQGNKAVLARPIENLDELL